MKKKRKKKKKKEMMPLTNEEKKLHCKQKVCYICKKRFNADDDNKNIIRSEVIVITQENIEELLMTFAIYNKKHKKKFL